MKRDPTEYRGVPVELPPRLLDVPLAMRVSNAIAALLRGTLIETKKRSDLTVLASCLQEAALRAAKAADRRSFALPEGGAWAQGVCLWMDDAESASHEYRALAAEGKLGVQTDLTDRERHAAALDEVFELRRERDVLAGALEEIKTLCERTGEAGEEERRRALAQEIPLLTNEALRFLRAQQERPGRLPELPF
jgi:hypothetical protein